MESKSGLLTYGKEDNINDPCKEENKLRLWKAIVIYKNNDGKTKTESKFFENYEEAKRYVEYSYHNKNNYGNYADYSDQKNFYYDRKIFEYEVSSIKELHRNIREVENVVKHIESYWD